jgi:glycine/D-amino acid oxidase-like deaminating enzyme
LKNKKLERVKYLIVGQGLVGTWMSYYLDMAGISYKIINDPTIQSATSVASGVINPVTGRRIVQTWMIDTILPFAVAQYKAIADKLKIDIIRTAPIILIHPSEQMKDSFEYRVSNENIYLFKQDASQWAPYFKTPFGTGAIDECYWMDLNKMTKYWQQYLQNNNKFINDHFDCTDIIVNESAVCWKNIEAEKIIFCDGLNAMHNPYFKALPFAPNKGQALIVKIPGLPNKHIYKNNVSIVPWMDNLFWVGSNYEWTFSNDKPTEDFKVKMIQSLNQFLEIPYEVVDHVVGIRPANTQRRPFVGTHPHYPQLAICNGMGTKGCSLAPYFTYQLLAFMEHGNEIEPEADVRRFSSILKEINKN